MCLDALCGFMAALAAEGKKEGSPSHPPDDFYLGYGGIFQIMVMGNRLQGTRGTSLLLPSNNGTENHFCGQNLIQGQSPEICLETPNSE